MDDKHKKLFVIKQSKGCNFMLKMHQNTFGGRAPPGPAGELMRSPRPYIRNWGHTSNGDGRQDTWDGTGGVGNSPTPPQKKSQAE